MIFGPYTTAKETQYNHIANIQKKIQTIVLLKFDHLLITWRAKVYFKVYMCNIVLQSRGGGARAMSVQVSNYKIRRVINL